MKVLLSRYSVVLALLVWNFSCDAHDHMYPVRSMTKYVVCTYMHAVKQHCAIRSYHIVIPYRNSYRDCKNKKGRQDDFTYYTLAEVYPAVLCQSNKEVRSYYCIYI